MKVSPLVAPTAAAPQTNGAQSARERAINMLVSTPQAQQHAGTPPIDQNNISPENASIVRQNSTSEVTELASVSDTEQPLEAVETAPQEEAPKPTEDLSKQHQQLLRREKALRAQQRQQEQSFREREQALKAKEAELSAKGTQDLSGYIDKAKLTRDPLGTLASLGYSPDQIANMIMQNQQPLDPRIAAQIEALEAKTAKYEQMMEEQRKSQEDSQTAAYQAAVKQIETDAKKLVFTDPAYEMVKATNSVRDVVELIKRTHAEEGYVMSIEDAAQQVEDYLLEEATKLAGYKKVQSRLAPKVSTPSAKTTQEQSPATTKQPQQMKTLTNAASTGRKLSSRERALLAFKGELK